MLKKQRGFTIVELLIVIVVIGILAAIVIVAYNGVQQRANNTSRIAAANQAYKLVLNYKTLNGTYPSQTGSFCMTSDNNCTDYAGTVMTSSNSAFLTQLSKGGTVPAKVPNQSGSHGLYYNYYTGRTMNGVVLPVIIMYWLEGDNQQCGNTNVVALTGANIYTPSTTGYYASGGGVTQCWLGLA